MDAQSFLTELETSDFISVDSSVFDLEKLMAKTGHAMIPVIDSDSKIFGVVTAIDVIKLISSGGNPHAVKTWEICSHKMLIMPIDTELETLAREMIENAVHHVLMSRNDKVVGFVSSVDVIKRYVSLSRAENVA